MFPKQPKEDNILCFYPVCIITFEKFKIVVLLQWVKGKSKCKSMAVLQDLCKIRYKRRWERLTAGLLVSVCVKLHYDGDCKPAAVTLARCGYIEAKAEAQSPNSHYSSY